MEKKKKEVSLATLTIVIGVIIGITGIVLSIILNK